MNEPTTEELIKKANYDMNHIDCINLDTAIEVVDRLQQQADQLKIAVEALKDINQHNEIINPTDYKMSANWLISKKALAKIEGVE